LRRSNAQQIDALEIDESAYEQATDNFENSWVIGYFVIMLA
jgi:tRNA1Val (adenine37-N6)-methyltransferase